MKAILIGLGNIGLNYDLQEPSCIQTHAKALVVFGFDVLGVDSNAGQCDLAQRQYGFQCVDSLEQVPADYRADLIIVASATESHLSHALWAIEQNPSVVLLEKPLVSKVKELISLVQVLQNAQPQVMVNLIRNYDSLTLSLLKQLPNGATINVEYSQSLLHNGIHFLALLIKVFGPVENYEVLASHPAKPLVQFRFQNCSALFRPEPSDTDNRLFAHSDTMILHFLNGGREIHIERADLPAMTLSGRLSTYQESVMASAIKLIKGEQMDDSFAIAREAQWLIHSVLGD
ncbi:MAG: Gfo/Idh/MocA family oxidoreductase [Reinekea sp.]|jgi:predicted dehydrogenase